MTIASEITRINTNIANAYTACSNKGATIPATADSANLASTIVKIPDMSFNGLSSVSADGLKSIFKNIGISGSVAFPDLTTIDSNGLFEAFFNNNITSVDLSSLTTLGNYGLRDAFSSNPITSVDLSSLTAIPEGGLQGAFSNCTNLNSIDLSSATSIGYLGMQYTFYGCSSLTSITLNISNCAASSCFQNAFENCTSLASVSFPALTTSSFGTNNDQFVYMMRGTGSDVTHTIHFPSNLQSTISDLSGYPTFSGSSGYVTLAFDLPATS